MRTGGDRAAAWMARVDSGDQARAREVLELLGLGGIYSVDDAYPDVAAMSALHEARYGA